MAKETSLLAVVWVMLVVGGFERQRSLATEAQRLRATRARWCLVMVVNGVWW